MAENRDTPQLSYPDSYRHETIGGTTTSVSTDLVQSEKVNKDGDVTCEKMHELLLVLSLAAVHVGAGHSINVNQDWPAIREGNCGTQKTHSAK